ncbi:non-histone chromosomal protein 6 [Eurytemora carolleeae]|uniref:non-histone chromosomal protein 6 n=1 Tax=Eurytemora carolleeae TaxID=1294199 RepID=UPI000C7734B6|nr:non-histone chromosomal protein 6 [Eurytemora carolleeae]|eukprot:XP_023341425.1 non-histone chromosomal protein 6-like [Eurytemora affinis]
MIKRFIQCEDLDKKKESEKKPTPKKGKKEKRDPNKPKQGMTAFFLFMNKKRERCMAANPDFSVTEVAKVLSRQWKEMSEEMKAPYMLQQEKDKIRFAKEMESYKQQEKEKIRLTKMMDAAPQAEL